MKKSILLYISIFFSAMLAVPAPAQTTGSLYGITNVGGAFNYGTLFYYDPLNNKDSVLLNFNNVNGGSPYGSLLQALNGRLYGITYSGGGVLFYYDPTNGKDSTILHFTIPTGYYPSGSLIQA